ncbi:MAG: hypothetical protein ABIL52_05210 [candidate division WOR-3 bacterium]
MFELILTLTIQTAGSAQPSGQAHEHKASTETSTKTEKYAGGYFVYIVKGETKIEYKLGEGKTIDKDAFQKEISSIKGVKEVKYDEKTKAFTITVDDDKEIVKVITDKGFVKAEAKKTTK